MKKFSTKKSESHSYPILTNSGLTFYSNVPMPKKVKKLKRYSDKFNSSKGSNSMRNLYNKVLILRKHKNANLDENIEKWKNIIFEVLDIIENEMNGNRNDIYCAMGMENIISRDEIGLEEAEFY